MACADILTFVDVHPYRKNRASQRKVVQEHLNHRQKNRPKPIKWRQTVVVGDLLLKVKSDETGPEVRVPASSTAPSRLSPEVLASIRTTACAITRWRLPPAQKSNYSSVQTLTSNIQAAADKQEDKDVPSPIWSPTTGHRRRMIRDDDSSLLHRSPASHRVNPFASYADEAPLGSIELLVDHAVRHFWPSLYPSQRHEANAIFLPHLSSSRLAYCTYLMNISLSYDYLHGRHVHHQMHSLLRLQCMYEASKIVQDTINALPSQPSGDCISDTLIATVCCLSSASAEFIVPKGVLPSRFKSPLATAQHLDMWGTAGFSEPHRLAVVRLVQLKGGLDKLAFSGLAAIIKLADLIDSSMKMQPPMLSYPDETLPQYASNNHSINDSLGTLDGLIPLPAVAFEHSRLVAALSAAANATAHLKAFVHDCQPAEQLMYLCDVRSRAHHLALSLTQDPDLGLAANQDLPHTQLLYKLVRISLLIYNNLVLFPLPPVTGLDTALSLMLYNVCQEASQDYEICLASYPHVILWSLMLGGISDSKDTCKVWYQRQFARLLNSLELKTWAEVEHCLSSFLWYDLVLNEQAMSFWSETVLLGAHREDIND